MDSPEPAWAMYHGFNRHDAGARVCQVAGCAADLAAEGPYCLKKRICNAHRQDAAVLRTGSAVLERFCFQCGKLQPLHMFDGAKRSCRTRLERRRLPAKRCASWAPGSDDAAPAAPGGVKRSCSLGSAPIRIDSAHLEIKREFLAAVAVAPAPGSACWAPAAPAPCTSPGSSSLVDELLAGMEADLAHGGELEQQEQLDLEQLLEAALEGAAADAASSEALVPTFAAEAAPQRPPSCRNLEAETQRQPQTPDDGSSGGAGGGSALLGSPAPHLAAAPRGVSALLPGSPAPAAAARLDQLMERCARLQQLFMSVKAMHAGLGGAALMGEPAGGWRHLDLGSASGQSTASSCACINHC